MAFDVALHLGTALAVLFYFWRDWVDMLISLKKDVINVFVEKSAGVYKLRHKTQVLITILIVSIPVGITGVILESYIETQFRSPAHVAIMLILVSFIMWIADRRTNSYFVIDKMPGFIDFLLISLSQILALFPGSSRSGITISVGLFRGLAREKAARFSFLIATPIIVGAGLLKLPGLFYSNSTRIDTVIIGFAVSFITGLIVVKWLLNFLKNKGLGPFIIYRILLGIAILISLL